MGQDVVEYSVPKPKDTEGGEKTYKPRDNKNYKPRDKDQKYNNKDRVYNKDSRPTDKKDDGEVLDEDGLL